LQVRATDIEFLLGGWEGDVDAGHVDVVEELRGGCDCHYTGTAARTKGADVGTTEFGLCLGRLRWVGWAAGLPVMMVG
jgi:hypothetical protein